MVNPIRGRRFWVDKTLKPLVDQYELIRRENFAATWLVSYDVLDDEELLGEMRRFDSRQEFGAFLEISPALADKARVIYPPFTPWFSPKAVFLSGYAQSERKRLIDEFFKKFKLMFGYYPASVGAWWIDSYSLNYMKERYNIKSAMIVADQKTTDNYGVWGQWWGIPYYPSKANILTPASSLRNKQEVVILQWAQRDPLLAYGEGPAYSNYSLQANDYIRQGKDTSYFQQLVSTYLSCQNLLGQVTVGLETGIESVDYIGEYANQLKVLKDMPALKSVTMSEFAKQFAMVYPQLPQQVVLENEGSVWVMTPFYRENKKLGDFIPYNPEVSFSDWFVADKSDFLDRRLGESNDYQPLPFIPYFLIGVILTGVWAFCRLTKVWLVSMLFSFSAFGLIFKSHSQYGWQIFYGPRLPYLELYQVLLILAPFLFFFVLYQIKSLKLLTKSHFLWLFPLSFGFDFILQHLRATLISNNYYFGVMLNPLKFLGISFSYPLKLNLIYQDFPAHYATAFLKFDFTKIWDNLYLSLLIYPLTHIILAILLGYLMLKLPPYGKIVFWGVMGILFSLYLLSLFQADPRIVVPLFSSH